MGGGGREISRDGERKARKVIKNKSEGGSGQQWLVQEPSPVSDTGLDLVIRGLGDLSAGRLGVGNNTDHNGVRHERS